MTNQQELGSHEFIFGYQQKSYTASPWATLRAGIYVPMLDSNNIHIIHVQLPNAQKILQKWPHLHYLYSVQHCQTVATLSVIFMFCWLPADNVKKAPQAPCFTVWWLRWKVHRLYLDGWKWKVLELLAGFIAAKMGVSISLALPRPL